VLSQGYIIQPCQGTSKYQEIIQNLSIKGTVWTSYEGHTNLSEDITKQDAYDAQHSSQLKPM